MARSRQGSPWTVWRSWSSMWRARSTVAPCRSELARLRLSSESRAAREKPSLARSCALGARSCPLRLAHVVGLFEKCYKSPRIRTPAFHVRGRSGDFLLACAASRRRHSQAGRAALGHPALSCARRPGRRPACHGAVLAAIALEHGATVCTTDRDLSRFSALRWTNPLAANG